MVYTAFNSNTLVLQEQQKPLINHLKERSVQHLRIKNSTELKQFYKFGAKIGQGGFGVVLSVTDKNTAKEWAMKTVVKTMEGNCLLLVKREIEILQRVQHPHIIYLDKVFETPTKWYLVLEKCCGELTQTYNEQKPFDEQVAKKIMMELADAVAYLHKYGIVHRDLKMENILIGENPSDPTDNYYIKLTDFGLSIVRYGSGIDDMLEDVCGTLTYMAPEIITNRSYSQQCDCWSMGVILFMMVVGNFPFYSTSNQSLQRQIIEDRVPLRECILSSEVVDLIERLLTKNPANRLTAAEILTHAWITGQRSKSIGSGNSNILEMMREWRSENETPTGKSENGTGRPGAQRQVLDLPKTDIKFCRQPIAGASDLNRTTPNGDKKGATAEIKRKPVPQQLAPIGRRRNMTSRA